MRKAEPTSEIRQFKVPRQRWIRYDKMNLPGGYAIVGDALCGFDPVFGQGMTVASIEAELLSEHLGKHAAFDAKGFARACARVISVPWMVASVEAFRYCLAEAGLTVADVDAVAYYESPVRKLARQLWSGALAAGSPALDPRRPERLIRERLGLPTSHSRSATILTRYATPRHISSRSTSQ